VTVTTLHPYLEVAKELGLARYQRLASNLWLGEALYAPLVFPGQREAAGRLAQRLVRAEPGLSLEVEEGINGLDRHLDSWLAAQPWGQFDLVGFSVCFQQLFASLAAARRLKEKYPDLPVVFGGSSCAGEAGASLAAVFPEIDFVISGEGEAALLDLCRTLAVNPAANGMVGTAAPAPLALATLPPPDYDDYFVELARVFGGRPFVPELPVEFSCGFCLQWRGYRAKPAARMLAEVTALAARHGCLDFAFTDNVLPPKESGEFFRRTAALPADFRFFAEIRAKLPPATLAGLRSGGLTVVQAGIEALSDSLLARMGKGTSVFDNLLLMRNCLAAGIRLEGNLILEFPGSSEEEAAETLRILDFLWPFSPLSGAAFFLGHGSPVAMAPEKYGVRARGAHPHYRALIPPEILSRLTLLIQDHRGERRIQRRRWALVRRRLALWQRQARQRGEAFPARPLLSWRQGGDFIIIRQVTPAGEVLHHTLRGTSRRIYLACDQPVTLTRLRADFPAVGREKLVTFLAGLERKRLLFAAGERYLALAIREPRPDAWGRI